MARTTVARNFVLAATVAAAALFTAPLAHADTALDMQVKDSLVWIQVEWDGWVNVPAQYMNDNKAAWSQEMKTFYTCSGAVVDPAGFVVTAGHCVDPANPEVTQDIYQALFQSGMFGQLSDADVNDMVDTATTEEWPVEGQAPGTPVQRTVQVIQPEGINDRQITNWTTVQVTDFQSMNNGDIALLKVGGLKPLKALPVASTAPPTGAAVTSIGFPGSVADSIADPNRLPQPSFKTGTVSGNQVDAHGVQKTEVSAALSAGMSGGPTIDEKGQIVGLNEETPGQETQPFNFITDAAGLRAFLVKNNVQMVSLSAPARGGSDLKWFIIGAVVLVLAAVAVALLVLLRRRRPQFAAAGGPPVSGYPIQGHDQGSSDTVPDAGAVGLPATATSGTPEATEPNFCPSCGAPHRHDEYFCPKCGKPVTPRTPVT